MTKSYSIVSGGPERLNTADQHLANRVGATLLPLVQSKLMGMECDIKSMSITCNTPSHDLPGLPAASSSGTARLTLCIFNNSMGPLVVKFDGGDKLASYQIELKAPGDYYVQQTPQMQGWKEVRGGTFGIKFMLVSFHLRKRPGSRSLVSCINGHLLRNVYTWETKPLENLCKCAVENHINPQGSSFAYTRPLPDFLFIQLARNLAGAKDTTSVVVPEIFAPEPWWFTKPEYAKGSYHLTRLVVFTGSIQSGHYTVYCLHEGIWWLKDDLNGQSSDGVFGGSGVTKARQDWLSTGGVRTNCCLLVYTKTGSVGTVVPPTSCSHKCGSGIQLPPKALDPNMSTASLCFSDRRVPPTSSPGPPGQQSDAVRSGPHRPTGPLAGEGTHSCVVCKMSIALPKSPRFKAYYRVVSRLLGFEMKEKSGLPLLCLTCWRLKNPISSRVLGSNPISGETRKGKQRGFIVLVHAPSSEQIKWLRHHHLCTDQTVIPCRDKPHTWFWDFCVPQSNGAVASMTPVCVDPADFVPFVDALVRTTPVLAAESVRHGGVAGWCNEEGGNDMRPTYDNADFKGAGWPDIINKALIIEQTCNAIPPFDVVPAVFPVTRQTLYGKEAAELSETQAQQSFQDVSAPLWPFAEGLTQDAYSCEGCPATAVRLMITRSTDTTFDSDQLHYNMATGSVGPVEELVAHRLRGRTQAKKKKKYELFKQKKAKPSQAQTPALQGLSPGLAGQGRPQSPSVPSLQSKAQSPASSQMRSQGTVATVAPSTKTDQAQAPTRHGPMPGIVGQSSPGPNRSCNAGQGQPRARPTSTSSLQRQSQSCASRPPRPAQSRQGVRLGPAGQSSPGQATPRHAEASTPSLQSYSPSLVSRPAMYRPAQFSQGVGLAGQSSSGQATPRHAKASRARTRVNACGQGQGKPTAKSGQDRAGYALGQAQGQPRVRPGQDRPVQVLSQGQRKRRSRPAQPSPYCE